MTGPIGDTFVESLSTVGHVAKAFKEMNDDLLEAYEFYLLTVLEGAKGQDENDFDLDNLISSVLSVVRINPDDAEAMLEEYLKNEGEDTNYLYVLLGLKSEYGDPPISGGKKGESSE